MNFTINNVCDWLRAEMLSDSTIGLFERTTKPLIEYLSESKEDFTLPACRRYIANSRKHYAPSTIRVHVQNIRRIVQYLYQTGQIDHDWSLELKMPKQEKHHNKPTLTPDEVNKICDCRDNLYSILFRFLAVTGVRISEATNTSVGDIDTGQERYYVRISKTEPRTLPLTKSTLDLLQPILKSRDPHEWLFINSYGNKLSGDTVRKELNLRLKMLDIKKKVTPHTFRHSFATMMLKAGCPLPQIQRLLGHADIKTTQRYIHLEIESLREALMTYHPIEVQNQTPEQVYTIIRTDVEKRIKQCNLNLDFICDQSGDGLIVKIRESSQH